MIYFSGCGYHYRKNFLFHCFYGKIVKLHLENNLRVTFNLKKYF